MSAIERWHRGLSGQNQMYHKTLLGENPGTVKTIRKTVSIPDTIKVGQKQIKFSKEEQQLLRNTPVMQQFDKFKELARLKSNSLTDTDLETAFRRLLVETPDRFDIVFDNDITTNVIGQKPTWYRGRTEGLSKVTTQDGITTTTRKRIYDTNMGIALPQLIYPFTDANYQRNQFKQPSGVVMRPLYKNGGKVVKAQPGVLLNPALVVDNKIAMPQLPTASAVSQTTPGLSGLDRIQSQRTFAYRPIPNIDIENTSEADDDKHQGSPLGSSSLLDLNVPLNWLRAAHSMAQSDKQLQNFLSRPRYYMHAPLLNAPRFIDSGQKAAYDAAANRTRMYKPVTSDATRNDAAIRQRQAEATNLEIQGNLAHSQEVGRYHAALDEFNNQNIIRNTEIANQNRHLDWQHDIEDVQAKNANIAEKSKFFDQAAYATQDWYNRQLGLAQQKRAREAGLDSITSLQKWYTDQISS